MSISSVSNNGQQLFSPLLSSTKAAVPEKNIEQRTQSVSGAASVETDRPVAQTQKTEVSQQELERAVKQTNEFLKPINNSIQFNLDTESGRTIIKVVDLETKETIRQFPSEEMLSIAKAIDTMKGLLIQQKA